MLNAAARGTRCCCKELTPCDARCDDSFESGIAVEEATMQYAKDVDLEPVMKEFGGKLCPTKDSVCKCSKESNCWNSPEFKTYGCVFLLPGKCVALVRKVRSALTIIWIKSKVERKGHGQKLVEYMLPYFGKARWVLGDTRCSERAFGFWQKCGFQTVQCDGKAAQAGMICCTTLYQAILCYTTLYSPALH